MQRQQYCLPEQQGCPTLSETFLARDDLFPYLHSNDIHHAYQSAYRHLQVKNNFSFPHILYNTHF